MKIKDLKITSHALALLTAVGIALGTLSGCNKQIVDLHRSFNVAIEEKEGTVSVVPIFEYSDYQGDMVQFVTEDGLRVLTSTQKTQLLDMYTMDDANTYALCLANGNEENVMNYNQLQAITSDLFYGKWNKDVLDFHYTYNKVVIFSDDSATIATIQSWGDYEEDDKIQIELSDGTFILTNMDDIKLVDDTYAQPDSLENYVCTLVPKEHIIYYEEVKQKVK